MSKLRPLSGRSFTSRSPTTPETEDGGGVDHGSLLGDGDLLGEFADLQTQIHHRFLAHLQIDAGAHLRFEAGLFGANLVGADRKGHGSKVARVVSNQCARGTALQAFDGDRRTAHCIAGGIQDLPGYGSRHLAEGRRAKSQKDQKEQFGAGIGVGE